MTDVGAAETRVVGRYDLLREVGRGGTAVVYLARQADLDRSVALKELAAFRAAEPEALKRFAHESRLAGSLNHPNVVTVHDYFEHDGTPYIAMEYFERGSLRPFVGRLTLAQAAGVLEGLLAGLAHAESRGVVHRDLKPENLMVTTNGGVKISDFGLARPLEEGAALTTTNTAAGTPAYMAPEQAMGKDVGRWTDLYAVGVIAYELLSGRLPFESSGLPLATVLQHLKQPVPPLRSVAPDIDPRLASWVERMLAKDPRKRPASAAQAWEELEEIVIGVLGPRWRRDSLLLDGELAPAREPVAPKTRRSRRAPLAVAGLLAAGAIAAAVAITTGGGAGSKDALPPRSEQVTLTASGPNLRVTDAAGGTQELSPSLEALGTTTASTAGALFVAGGEGDPVFVVRQNPIRLCEPGHACHGLGLHPTGLGVSPTGTVFVADALGYVLPFELTAGGLSPGDPIAVGPDPHGTFVSSRGRLYVPVRRGVAVVSPVSHKAFRVRTIHLPVSPAAIWVSPFSGKLFAALYASDSIAVVDTTLESATPKIFKGFSKPVAVTGTADYVYEVNAGARTICRLDAFYVNPRRCKALPHA